MIARSMIAALGAAVLSLAIAASAFAWSDQVEGKPDITHDSPAGYYLWHNDAGWHLQTHGPGDEHLFTARLHTNGTFEDVDSVRLESADSFRVVDAGHTIEMRFKTYDATDGLNFRVRDGNWVRFSLRLDGDLISTDSIYLGADGSHPRTNPFFERR